MLDFMCLLFIFLVTLKLTGIFESVETLHEDGYCLVFRSYVVRENTDLIKASHMDRVSVSVNVWVWFKSVIITITEGQKMTFSAVVSGLHNMIAALS